MLKSKSLIKHTKIKHGFFNNKNGVSTGIYKSLNCGPGSKDSLSNIKKNLSIVCNKIGCKKNKLVILNQIHSNKYFVLNNIPSKKLIGDGLITKKKGICLAVLTADCAPVLIYDKNKKIIAAVHVGWKGAYKKILIKIFKKLIKMGCKKKTLIAVVGPCIDQKSYEVNENFKKKFIKQNENSRKYFLRSKNSIFFSLGNYLRGQLYDLGVKNVDIIKKDTFLKKNNFFSYRYALKNNHNDYGRNISLIMIK